MTISESFTPPTSAIIPAYPYRQYSIDASVQAFFASQNSLSQEYLDWFNNTPLALYTSPNISGLLLDWIANGIYGIPRPVLSSGTSQRRAGYNSTAYDTIAYDTLIFSQSGTATIANDDIYKRVMTWNTYKGDGQVFSMFWLKNRINRFLNGVNGTDWPVLNNPPFIAVSGSTFLIDSGSGSPMFTVLSQAIANGVLALPFQYTFTVENFLTNDGGVLQVSLFAGWPTSSIGLTAGGLYNDGGVGAVKGPTTPNPLAPPVYFSQIGAQQLLALGGANLPLTNPGAGTGQLWNNVSGSGTDGVISIA